MNKHQTVFQKTYICSSEITQNLGIDRATLSRAVHRGLMPHPIIISNGATHLWLRDEVASILKIWKKGLDARRGV